MTPKAYILVGLPAAGKSTWISENLNSDVEIVSADNIKTELDDYNPIVSEQWHEKSVEIAAELFKKHVDSGKDVCLDGGGVNNSYTYSLAQYADGKYYDIIVVYFDTPAEVCIQRNEDRERYVPREVILYKSVKLHKCFSRLQRLADQVIEIRYYSNNHIFLDMDGTISAYMHIPLDEHGCINFVEGEYFRNALPVLPMLQKLKVLSETRNIYILSASPDNFCMAEKNEWLDQHASFIPFDNRFFIGNKDHKAVMLRNLLRARKISTQDTMMVDDNHSILLKLNQIGVNAVHPSMFLSMEF